MANSKDDKDVDEHALFNAQVTCSDVINDWPGRKCCDCRRIVTSLDVDQIIKDEVLVQKDHEKEALSPRCYSCDQKYHNQS